jgi:putative hydrolase of the HAD superfamily
MLKSKIKSIFFDVDGTLYKIPENSFLESKLNIEIEKRTIDYISKKLSINSEKSLDIFNEIKLNYPKKYSFGLLEKFNLNREDYLNFSWNVNPKKIIPNNLNLKKELEELSLDHDLYILSDAPLTWIRNLLNYMEINSFFKDIFSGANLGVNKKSGLFNYVLSKIKKEPENCIMVGDELENDIFPAQKVGIKTIYVGNEKGENKLSYPIKGILKKL